MNKGFTLLIAIITMGTLLLVASGVVGLALKTNQINSSSKESQYAFWAADSGVECALYWDVSNPTGFSAFATSSATTIFCNKDGSNAENEWSVGNAYSSTFTMTFLPDLYCARVVVTKDLLGKTTLESFGYNTCDTTSSRRVERAVKVTY